MTDQLMKDQVGTEAPVETSPPAPVRIAWAPVPKVNLLPIEILEVRQFRRTKILLGAAVVGVVLIAVAGLLWAQHDVTKANDELVASQAKVAQLTAEQAKYAAVPKVIGEVDAAKSARTLALGADVLWYRYLNDLDDATPAGVILSGLTFTLSSTTGVASAPSDPLSSHGVGTLAVAGSSETYQQVASWMEALNKITGLSSSVLNNAALTEGRVTFGSGAVVNTDAFSHRYDKDGS